MENIATVQRAFRFARDYYDHPTEYEKRDKAIQVAQKLGVSLNDLQAARSAQNLPTPEKNKIMGPIIDKLAVNSLAEDSLDSPVGHIERFNIKNLIDEDPDLQINYLNRKGYDARINADGDLEARKKGSVDYFRRVDPNHLEFEDVLDVAGDLVQGGIEGLATIGAGWSMPFIGGSVAAGWELGKQELAKLAGLRDDNNYERVAQKAGMGALFPILPAVVGRWPKNAAKDWANIPKKNVDEIIAVGKEMGAVPTQGMLSKNPRLQKQEDYLIKQPVQTMFNRDLNEQVAKNIDATDNYAESLLSGRIDIPRHEAGENISQSIVDSLNYRKKFAGKLYDDVEKVISRSRYQVDTEPLSAVLDNLEDRFKFTKSGRDWISSKRSDLERVYNISDVKKFNTSLKNDLGLYQGQDPIISGIHELRNEGKNLINKTFDDVLNEMQIASKSEQELSDVLKAREKLDTANKIYRQINEESNTILKNVGTESSGGPGTKIKAIQQKSYEDIFRRVLSDGDIKKARWMRETYPDETRQAIGAVLEEIFKKASNVRKVEGKQSFASHVSEQIRNMSSSKKEILFGKDGVKKADNLAKWFSEGGTLINPSGTSFSQSLSHWIMNNTDQAVAKIRYNFGFPSSKTNATLKWWGKAWDNPGTRGSSFFLGNEALKPFTSSEQSQQSKLPLIPME